MTYLTRLLNVKTFFKFVKVFFNKVFAEFITTVYYLFKLSNTLLKGLIIFFTVLNITIVKRNRDYKYKLIILFILLIQYIN